MKEQTNEQIHRLAIKRFNAIYDKEKDQRKKAIKDGVFVNSEEGQWDEDTVQKRRNRPRYTIDMISGPIGQLVGDQRQNRTAMDAIPLGGGATKDVAKILSGLLMNIERQSNATNIYDNAYDEELTGGYGGWRIITEHVDDDLYDSQLNNIQRPRMLPVLSAASTLFFGPAIKYDKRDAKHAFLITTMTKAEFKEEWPNAVVADFDNAEHANYGCNDWWGDGVRVAEYWVKHPITKTIALLSDDRVIDVGDEQKVIDELAMQGITIVRTKEVKSHKVMMYKISGLEILEGPTDWAGKYIPLVPVYGKQATVEKKTYTRGIVRKAKDAQQGFNYAYSTNVETFALTPKDPTYITPKMIAGHEKSYENFNVTNSPYLKYNPDPAHPGTPSKGGAPTLQVAGMELMREAKDAIYSTTQIFPPAQGNAPQLLSERSIISQAQMGDRGAFIYQDNLRKSQEYSAEILIDLIPRVMDTERVETILNIDGTTEEVTINQAKRDDLNQPVKDRQTNETVIVNDLRLGQYGVTASTGPNYKTMRQETVDQLSKLGEAYPAIGAMTADLVVKNSDILESEEAHKRIRKQYISEGIADPTDEEIEELGLNQPQQPDPTQQALEDNLTAMTKKTLSEAAKNFATAAETQNNMINDATTALETLMDSFTKALEAGIPLTAKDQSVVVKQVDIVNEAQQAVDPGPNSEQTAEIAEAIEQS